MLSKALRLIRVFHDLRQNELAEQLRISRSHLSEIESGGKTPSMQVLESYSRVFSIPLSSILFFAENLNGNPTVEKARSAISSKVLAMMELVAGNDERDGKRHET